MARSRAARLQRVGSPPTESPPHAGLTGATPYPLVKVGPGGEQGTGHGWASLTDAELRVSSCVARGMTNRGIAEELYLSRHTVDAHLKHVYLKLDIHSRVELTVRAMQHRVQLRGEFFRADQAKLER